MLARCGASDIARWDLTGQKGLRVPVCRVAADRNAARPPCNPSCNRAPGDAAIIKELHAIRATLAKEKQAQAQLFKGRLAAAPTSASKPPSESTSAARGDGAAQAAAAGAPTAGTSGGSSGVATAGGERQRRPAGSGQGAKQGPALTAGASAGGPLQQLLGVLWALPAHLFGWLGGVWHACITAWAPAKVQA